MENNLNELKEHISGLVLKGQYNLSFNNPCLQEYCRYAAVMGINFSEENSAPAWVCADGLGVHLNVNPIEMSKATRNDKEVIFIIAHEVLHLVLRHIQMYKGYFENDVTAVLMNICTDIEINTKLTTEFGCRPASALAMNFAKDLLGTNCMVGFSEKKQPMAVWLFEKVEKCFIKYFNKNISQLLYDCKIGKLIFSNEIIKVANGMGSSLLIPNTKYADLAVDFLKKIAMYLSYKLPLICISSDKIGSDSVLETFSDISDVDLEEYIDNLDSAVDIMKNNDGYSNKSRGTGNGSEGNYKKYDTNSQISWQGILKTRLSVLTDKYKPTKKRINRRQPDRLELSGRQKDVTADIVIGIDMSGSISDKELSYFCTEIKKIVSQFDVNVHLLKFTSTVKSYDYFPHSKVKKLTADLDSNHRFSGGTSFQPVFDYIKGDKNIKEDKTLLIMFTDGFGENSVDYGKVSNRLWVVVGTGDGNGVSCGDSSKNIYHVTKF